MKTLILLTCMAVSTWAKPSGLLQAVHVTGIHVLPHLLQLQYDPHNNQRQYTYGYNGATNPFPQSADLPQSRGTAPSQPLPRTDLPVPVQETPEVAQARQEHLRAVEAKHAELAAAVTTQSTIRQHQQPVQHHPVTLNLAQLPVLYQQYPAVPYNSIIFPSSSSQYHAQDELGQYSYGYANALSSKSEAKTVDGTTRGNYAYLDANGIVQHASYISDAVNGFRVSASNLPVAPIAPTETPEVRAAKSALETAHNEARQRLAEASQQ